MLYQVPYTSKIDHNILKSFKQIHARRVCHRDIRPEDILVGQDGSVVVIALERSELEGRVAQRNEGGEGVGGRAQGSGSRNQVIASY